MTDLPNLLPNIDTMTWDQLESERRSILSEMVSKYGTFEQAPEDLTKRFIDVSHKARLMVKPAGKPAAEPKERKTKTKKGPVQLSDLEL